MPKRRTEPPPSMERLLQRFEYRPETVDQAFWKERPVSDFSTANSTYRPVADPQLRAAKIWNKRFAGKPAFTFIGQNGYRAGLLDYKAYYLHQIVWALATGAWPDGEIDHLNGNILDNRIENLRVVDRSQQMQNRRARPNRDGLPRGVWRNNQIGGKVYIARIQINGRAHYLGAFDTPEEAHAAYLRAAEELHGSHAFHLSRSKG